MGWIDVLNEGISTADIFVYIFVICKLEKHEKIALMKMKKVSCGSQMSCALGQEPPNFFTWPKMFRKFQKDSFS